MVGLRQQLLGTITYDVEDMSSSGESKTRRRPKALRYDGLGRENPW